MIATPASSIALLPGSRLQGGRYVIKQVLGEGGMGTPLLAEDVRLAGKLVVLKELLSERTDPQGKQEEEGIFKREVSALCNIDHPLLPDVTDNFREGTRYFLVQEYVEGESLEQHLERTKQPMWEHDALVCASEVLDILEYLAMQTPPIVHHNIKPANLIIEAKDKRKRVHLVGIGIARANQAKNAQRKLTTALGTPGYAPLEQYQGYADPRSDLYALAATLHHILTGRDPHNYPPFFYPPVCSLNAQLSPEIEHVLIRALTNDRNQRYQSAATMKQDIDKILWTHHGIYVTTDYTVSSVASTSGHAPDEVTARMQNSLHIIYPLMAAKPIQAIKIFYCYAHKDRGLRDELENHLGALKRSGEITDWYDREIQAGMEWEPEIEKQLKTSRIILLLVSSDFISSDYCYSIEMKKALELHRTGQARVIPIILRPVDWQGTPLVVLQALPTDAKPITLWANQDEAFEDIARNIRMVIKALRTPASQQAQL